MTILGKTPSDLLTDSKGNVLKGITLTFFGSESDALAQLSPLGTATTNGSGRWTFDAGSTQPVWARDPSGNVWAVLEDHDTAKLNAADFNTTLDTRVGGDSTNLAVAVAGKVDLTITGVVQPATVTYADVQAAANTAASTGRRLVVAGTLTTSSTLTITSHCDLSALTIDYTGTGTALVLGDPVNGVTRKVMRVGRVVSSAFTTGWATAGAIGVQIVDVNKSRIEIGSVTKFLVGVQMLGHARGCTYNSVSINELATNKVNMQQTADAAAGFCNQNQVSGGSWNHDSILAGGTGVAGTRHVVQDASGGGPVPDTNLFSGCAFEGNVVEQMVNSIGKMNTFRDCRWEAATPVVVWGSGSYGNAIRDGYKPELVSVTNSGDLDNVITWPKSGDLAAAEFTPRELYTVAGTAAATNVVRIPTFSMIQNDIIALGWTPPPNWHTYDVELHLFHDQASAGGTTQWLWRPAWLADGGTATQPAGGTSRTVTLGGQRIKKVSTIETGLAVTAGSRLNANLVHNGGTLGGIVQVTAIVLRRRS